MLLPNKPAGVARRLRRWVFLGLGALCLAAGPLAAQHAQPRSQEGDFTLSVEVDLVVLHTTVIDRRGRLVTDLAADHFRIYEDNVQQKLSVFRNEDVPVTVGLVLDNSASMKENRREMMAGALIFAQTSNPLDEVFVVNFNDDYYLDLEGKDFTHEIEELKEALDRTSTRGGTALFDALRASLEHLKRGTRQKKVLLVVTDGVDHLSYTDFDTLLHEAQQAETAFYLVGLPCTEEGRDCRRARRQLRKLSDVTGGRAYFPTSIEQVQSICRQIAHDIRNQYVLGYYPSNRTRDGSFRHVRVEIHAPKGYRRLSARTRPGYFAPRSDGAGSQ